MVHCQRAMGAHLLFAGLILLGLLQSCSAAPGTGTAKLNTTKTCGTALRGIKPYDCRGSTIFDLKNANRTDISKGICCLKEINVKLTLDIGNGRKRANVGDTVIFTFSITNVKSVNVDVTNVTSDENRSGIKYVEPFPAGCVRQSYPKPRVDGILICTGFTLAPGDTKVLNAPTLVYATSLLGLTATPLNVVRVLTAASGLIDNSYSSSKFVAIRRTCGKYSAISDGTNVQYSAFECPSGSTYNASSARNTVPKQRTCCTRVPVTTGACCIGTDQCSIVTSANCTSLGGAFLKGQTSCSATTCTAKNCTPSWLPCLPCTGPDCTDSCCTGSSCKVAVISGAKQYYTCVPEATTCQPEGGRCGDCQGGGVCCSGLLCKWSWGPDVGTCAKPYPCGAVGGSCSANGECCPGNVCTAAGTCQVAMCDVNCARTSPGADNCRSKDCKALASAAASGAQRKL